MKKPAELIREAKLYQAALGERIREKEHAARRLHDALQAFENQPDPSNRFELECLLAYFEKTFKSEPVLDSLEPGRDESSEYLTVRIDGPWRAFDFEQFFESVDYLNKLFVIASKLHSSAPDMRMQREMTRSHVVREARLYYYLTQHEELRVRQVQFASPGLVKFQGLAVATKEIRIFLQYLINMDFIRAWVNHAHNIRKEFGLGELERARKVQMLEKLRASTNQIRRGEETNAIAQTKRLLTECIDLAAEMEAKGLADGSRVIDRFVTSVERLHHLGYDSRKISMRPDDDSRT